MPYTISLKRNAAPEDCICITEELGRILLTLCCISGTALAQTPEEKNIISFLIKNRKKKEYFLKITEIPFSEIQFLEQKQFLCSVLDGITEKIGWELLPQPPREAVLFVLIAKLRCFLQKLTWEDVAEEQYAYYIKP